VSHVGNFLLFHIVSELAGWVSGCVCAVTVFSPNIVLGVRRLMNVKFGTKVASSRRMMRSLRFLEKEFQLWKNWHFLAYFWRFFAKCHFFQKHSHSGAKYTQKQHICGATMRVCASDSA